MVTRASTVFVVLVVVYSTSSKPLNDLPNPHAVNNLNRVNSVKDPQYDTNVTIQEVEEIIKKDPSLPRLTRGEILDIIDNITVSDRRVREQKAVMLVMPYSANSSDTAHIQELFTKAPITKIIGTEPFVVKSPNVRTKSPFRYNSYKSEAVTVPKVTDRPSTTTTEQVFLSSEESSTASTTHQPKRRRRPTPVRFSNHKYPEDKLTQQTDGLRIIQPPKLDTQEQLITVPPFIQLPQTLPPQASYRPKLPISSPFSVSQRPDAFNLPDLPNDLKSALNNLNIQNYNVEINREENTYDIPEISQEPQLNLDDLNDGYQPQAVTTTTHIPDIARLADTLTPEMKELLTNIGLLGNPYAKPSGFTETPVPIKPEFPDITRDSYLKFKPLPESVPAHGEMEEFLERFGLGRATLPKRKPKSYQTVPDLPEKMKEVLMEMELIDEEGKKTAALNNNVFKPSDKPSTTEEEIDKLNQLLDIIKQLEKLNSTTDNELNKTIDLDRINKLVGSLNRNQLIPLNEQNPDINPINDDYGLSKNEVKRQENSTILTSSEESVTSNVKDLEASFGGGGAMAVELTETIPPPTEAPKTGFYYLLDWNSFLEVDDQKGKRVNLRFQPKAGDPRQFLSVTVP